VEGRGARPGRAIFSSVSGLAGGTGQGWDEGRAAKTWNFPRPASGAEPRPPAERARYSRSRASHVGLGLGLELDHEGQREPDSILSGDSGHALSQVR